MFIQKREHLTERKNHTEQNKLMTFILSNSVFRETEKKWVFDYRYINFLQLYSCSFKAILIITHNICFLHNTLEL